MEGICRRIVPDLSDEITAMTELHEFTIDVDAAQPAEPKVNRKFAGFEGVTDSAGSKLIVGHLGIVYHMLGPYQGRENLISMITRVIEILQRHEAAVKIARTSIAVKSNIDPPFERYLIEDYVVPAFNFGHESVNTFAYYRHDVALDLQHIAPNLIAKVVIECPTDGRTGIDVTIDALDHRICELSDAYERLEFVKNVETHVYEQTITDKTRELNGCM